MDRSNMPGLNTQVPNGGSNQNNDQFLLSLLNHITLPPQAPQSVSSPSDLYMSNLGWSPQANMASQQYNSAQYNMAPTSYTDSSYINQAQLMGLNPAQTDNHRRDSIGNSATRSPDRGTWNGYFGSS